MELMLVVPRDDYRDPDRRENLLRRYGADSIAPGGPSRQASVYAGLRALRSDAQVVLIHDAVRPFVSPRTIAAVAAEAARHGAALAAVPARETIKCVDSDGLVRESPPRRTVWLARTPQGFRRDLILRAHEAAAQEGFVGTDDEQLVGRLGVRAKVVPDTEENIKITTPLDLALAEALLAQRRQGGSLNRGNEA